MGGLTDLIFIEESFPAVFDLDEPIMENLEVNVDKNLQKPLNFTADVL